MNQRLGWKIKIEILKGANAMKEIVLKWYDQCDRFDKIYKPTIQYRETNN